jgi:pimeloyl-ACP methyl ester carboxylesterase
VIFRSVIISVLLAGGCATATVSPGGRDSVIVVPGIGGDGGPYARIASSLHDSGCEDCIRVSDWGSSYPVFFISIALRSWHQSAERRLAGQILVWRKEHPGGRIALIAHSAGAGVVAGAVAQLPAGVRVGPVVFLAPALSPGFDLRGMLDHTTVLHVFFSPDDFFWQGLGPTIFGNYDRVHSAGAGEKGFTLASLDAEEKSRIVQHAYESDWKKFDNFGGHYDWTARPFVAAVLAPLIEGQHTGPIVTADGAR